ncbi:MAG: hypothetical protein KDA31_11300 [Phycisphaerales bacterium]|nr:hypothetical protein [Phycisphaerales bacterium]MCB9835407.1 hypothetical protein [Phycisphaera sp.]
MLHPAPTTKIDPKLARGVLEEVLPATATKPAYAVISFPNTSYRVHLEPVGEITGKPGKTIVGTIRARAKRIDTCATGGKFIDPVFGRPRRVQGSIVAIEGDWVVVNAGMPVYCQPTAPGQSASHFAVGQFVSMGVEGGTSFEQVSA